MVTLSAAGASEEIVNAGLDALVHRGPDGRGSIVEGPVGIGHTRLALSGGPSGTQPFRRGASFGTVNGELYNHEQLRSSYPCETECDSEVLLAAIERDGARGFERCSGVFALAHWDGGTLIAARDRFGVKPLYWTWDGELLLLASEVQALLAMGARRAWDSRSVEAMLAYQYLPPSRTLFADIHALEPGHWLEARPGRAPTISCWWKWQGEVPGEEPNTDDIHSALEHSVTQRCRADQPVACQLSGGLDSALVAALARDHGVTTAYTVGFAGEQGWDEAAAAARVAQALGLEHVVLKLDQPTLLAHLDEAVLCSGGSVINTHVAAKLLLCRQVRADGHAVLLSGEGADELFWGYEHLVRDWRRESGLSARAGSAAVAGVHLPLGETLDTSIVKQSWGQVPSFLEAKATLGHRLHSIASIRAAGAFENLVSALGQPPSGSSTNVSAWAWARLCLAGSILQRLCDPLEMAAGVEGRMPFLDLRVAELAARVPPKGRIQGDAGKWPLRRLARRLLGESVSTVPKHPFMGPPLVIDDVLETRLLDGPALPFVSRPALENQLRQVRNRPAAARVPWDPVWLTVLSCQALQRGYGL